jgi:DNA-binding transcriptional regulator GbsR (MarR family)
MPLLTGAELSVVLFVCRRTFGWGKESAALGLTSLVEGTGLGKSSVRRALESLISVGLLKVTRAAGRESSVYEIVIPESDSITQSLQKRKIEHDTVSKMNTVQNDLIDQNEHSKHSDSIQNEHCDSIQNEHMDQNEPHSIQNEPHSIQNEHCDSIQNEHPHLIKKQREKHPPSPQGGSDACASLGVCLPKSAQGAEDGQTKEPEPLLLIPPDEPGETDAAKEGVYPQEFLDLRDRFAKAVDKKISKIGPLMPAFKHWRKLSITDRRLIEIALPVAEQDDVWERGYAPYFRTYISDEQWREHGKIALSRGRASPDPQDDTVARMIEQTRIRREQAEKLRHEQELIRESLKMPQPRSQNNPLPQQLPDGAAECPEKGRQASM